MSDNQAEILPQLGELITRQARWVLMTIGALVLSSMAFIPTLRFDFSPQALFETNETLMQRADDFKDIFGHAENILTLVYTHSDIRQPGALRDIATLSTTFEQFEEVSRVHSVTYTALPRGIDGAVVIERLVAEGDEIDESLSQEAAELISGSALVRGRLAASDASLAVVALYLNEDQLPASNLVPLIDRVKRELDSLELTGGGQVDLGGIPAVRSEAVRRLMREQMTFIPLSIFVSALVLLFLYRSGRAVALPVLTVLSAVGVSVGWMAALDEPINILNNTLATLIYTIGMSDAVHLLSRYREERGKTDDAREAAARTFTAMAVACFLTSWTTAVGFLSLVTSNTQILQRYGATCAIGVLIAYVLTIALLPAALAIFDIQPKGKTFKLTRRTDKRFLEELLVSLTTKVLDHPRIVLAGGFVFGLLMIPGIAKVRVDSTMLEIFPKGDRISQVINLQQEHLDGVLPVEISLKSSEPGAFEDPDVLNAIDRSMARGAELEGVLAATSMTTWMRDLWRVWTGDDDTLTRPFRSRAQAAQLLSLLEDRRADPLSPWVTMDRSHARVEFRIADIGGKVTLTLGNELEEIFREELGPGSDIRVMVTGDAWTGSTGLLELIRDFLVSISWAFVFIFGFMVLTFRSLYLGLISFPTNVLPLLFTLSVMGHMGIWLNTTTVILFSISLGLAVDSSIHYLARYVEERGRGLDKREAILAAARGAGRAIVLATLLIGLGLGVLWTSTFIPTKRFALLTSLTLAGCLVADLILLPALVITFRSRKDREELSAINSEG